MTDILMWDLVLTQDWGQDFIFRLEFTTPRNGCSEGVVIESKIEEVKITKPIFTNTENKKYDYKSERKPLHKVKMSNLPVDMTEEELLELLYEWGRVIRLRLLNYDDNSTAYVEFKDETEAKYLVESEKEYPVSFNGKMCFTIKLPLDLSVPQIQEIVMADERTIKQLEGRTPNKVIIVPGKVINLVG